MANLNRAEKLLKHFADPARNPMTEELENYRIVIDYAYDCLKKYPRKVVLNMVKSKVTSVEGDCSIATAYNVIRETKQFFSMDENSHKSEFERMLSIEHREQLYQLAFSRAKTPKDFLACSKIRDGIDELRGLFTYRDDLDYDKLQPTLVQFVVPSKTRTRVIELENLKKEDISKVIDAIEGFDYTVEDMSREIKKLNADV